ncbi:MAG: hypothetical protein HeimC3_06940 [Candidatus Heimdallarchaeota archaeon LC_3]|nr:MAG: hypothetical protein HeimC3_06940 [Candidatus Heimdallarchaeota archaeon LC_3]
MSELVKLAYRGFGGFIAVVLIFSFSVTAFALFMSGIGVIFGAIYVLIDPGVLDTISFNFLGSRLDDASIAALLLVVATMILFLVASFFVGLVLLIWKSALKLDEELGKIVDKTIPSIEGGKPDKISQLERLGALRSQGVLSEEEFNKEKAKILQEYE